MFRTKFSIAKGWLGQHNTGKVRLKNSSGGSSTTRQCCQMVYFQTKNPNLGKFWRALVWKMLIYFMDIWNISTDIWDSL
jgi:hypothetical protein